MFGHKFVRAFFASMAIAGMCLISPAFGQAVAPAPLRQSVDANGVDLFLGTMNTESTRLVMGAGDYAASFYNFIYGSGWQNNVSASIYVQNSSLVHVTWQGRTVDFNGNTSTGFSVADGSGATLAYTGGLYIFTTADGTKVRFDPSLAAGSTMYVNGGFALDATYPNGRKVTYNYEQKSYLVKHQGPDGPEFETVTVYRLSSITNSSGYTTQFTYAVNSPGSNGAAFDRFYTVTAAQQTNTATGSGANQTLNMAFDSTGNLFTVTDPMGRATTYRTTALQLAGITRPGKSAEDITIVYDTSNRVQSVTTPVGTTTYAYADAGGVRTTTVTDPGGHATVYTFNIASNLMLSATDPLSKTKSWQYDTSGRITQAIAPEGNYTQFSYDARGNVTETRNVAKSGSGLADIVTTAGYDVTCSNYLTCNQPNWTKDAKGNQTDYTYDATTGNVLSVAAPAATVGGIRPTTTNSYTTTSGIQLLTGTSTCQTTASCVGTADEVKTTIGYNSNLLPTTVTKAAGDNSLSATTTMGYDDFGNILTVDGPLAGTDDTTTYRYDADHEQVGVISADPDGAGPLKRRAVRTTYNNRGFVTLVEVGTVNGTADADWSAFTSLQQTATTLDAADRKSQVALSAGGTTYALTQYSYDTDGRLDCTAVRMKPSTYTSLPASACTATTGTGDADRITKMAYDNANHVTKTTSAYGTPDASDDTTATYTANGQTASLTDANGNTTTYTYDGFDRLSQTNYPSTTKGSGTSSATDYEQLTYDANGNITSKRLRDGSTVAVAIDNLKRVTSRTENGTLSRQYGYNLLSQMTSSSWSGGGSPETMTYDALGRLTSRAEPYTTLSYQYNAAGRRTRVTWPDGLYINYNYDLANEMTTVIENGATTLATYSYDDLGRRTSLTRGNGTASYYSYDGASRLTCLRLDLAGGGTLDCNPTASGQDNAITFGYNPAGQIISRVNANTAYAWTGNVNVNRPYTTNGLNQYTASGSTSLGYDGRGNLNASGSSTFGYDALNHLVSTNGAASTLEYGSQDELQGYNLASSYPRFASDGGNIIGEYLWGASPSLQRRYVYGADTDEPLVWYEGTGTSDRRWLIRDERGSIVAVTNASGASIATNTYDEYGIPGASNQGRFQYTGQAWLSEVGLYHYKARMYSPTLGRFMQTDPTGYGDGQNWYNYAKGDPVNAVDPSGSMAEWEWECYGNCGGGFWNSPPQQDPSVTGTRNSDGTYSWASSNGYTGTYDPTTNSTTVDGYTGQFSNGSWSPGGGMLEAGEILVNGSTLAGDLVEELDKMRTIVLLGRAGEEAAITSLIERGYEIVGNQVRVKTPRGLRIMDFITLKDGVYMAFEVKVNNSVYLPMQQLKDNLIYGGNGVSSGYGNPAFPYGTPIPPMPTTVMRVQCRLAPIQC